MHPPNLAIGMIACHRPNHDVHEAIAQLRIGGFNGLVHLFCEPGMPELRPMARVVVHRNPVQRGVIGNWSHCLRWLVDHTSADFLMVCEDDVEYCRGARTAWENSACELKLVGFWSLYTPHRDRELVGHAPGWVASNRGRDTWGTQCMCFPRSSAEIVLIYGPLNHEDQMRGPTDAIVAQCFVEAGIPCFYHNPSLANHLGKVSSVGHNWYDEHVGFKFDVNYFPADTAVNQQSGDIPEATKIENLPRRAAIVTVFQGNIPLEVVSAQAEVICRFLPRGCEFIPVEVSHHAIGLNDFFQELRHEAYLVFDIDCIPLAEWVIPWMLENALAGTLVGPAQRANHLDNGNHIYAGPSALAFSHETFERAGKVSFGDTPRGDVAEELTYECERLEIPITFLWPTSVEQPRWSLQGGITFGNGTTFGGAVYHAFSISKGETVEMFLGKCREVLKSTSANSKRSFFADDSNQISPDSVLGAFEQSHAEPSAAPVFNEQWYGEAELKRLQAAVRLTAKQEGAVIEIGSWEGRSTAVIANSCFPATVMAVDTWQGAPTEGANHITVQLAKSRDVFAIFEQNMRAMTRGNVIPHRVDALEFLRDLEGPIRFCHIDAAHDYESVHETLRLLIPKLSEGSVLFGHDYESANAGRADLNGGVERAVRELLPNHSAVGNTWLYIHS